MGVNLSEYMKTRLFDPLGIVDPQIQYDPQGRFYGASGMYLTVHELSLLGQLYLQKGVFDGRRIVSESWCSEAVKRQIDTVEGGYGYFFWYNKDHYSISGKWGQKCLVYPSKKLMITYLGDMPESPGKMLELAEKFAENFG